MKTLFVSNNFSRYIDQLPVIGELMFSPANTKLYIDQINNDTDSLDINVNFNNLSATIYPIRSGEEILAYLLSLSDKNSLSSIGTDLIYKKIVLALSILLLKEKAYLAYKNREFDISLEKLLNNEILTVNEIEKISENYNFPVNGYYVCCIVSFTKIREINFSTNWIGYKALKCNLIISYWNKHSESSCKLFPQKNNIVIILHLEKKINKFLDIVKCFCCDIQMLLTKNGLDKDVLIGIGGVSHGLSNLHSSYYQAKKTIEIMSKIKHEAIGLFDDYLIYELINNSPYIHDILKEKLLPLINYDQEHNNELLLTLETYINNNLNCTQAAKDLFIHRNTMIYRIDKINEILNIDYNNHDEILIYQLAIKALSI